MNELKECKEWQGHQDSNPGPTDLESVALPTELYPYKPAKSHAYFYLLLIKMARNTLKVTRRLT